MTFYILFVPFLFSIRKRGAVQLNKKDGRIKMGMLRKLKLHITLERVDIKFYFTKNE